MVSPRVGGSLCHCDLVRVCIFFFLSIHSCFEECYRLYLQTYNLKTFACSFEP